MGNLATPKSVQKLQTALHAKAKAEAGYRFYALYDKLSRDDILAHAYAQCRSNKGAPGVDGQDFADIEAYGVERWLGELALALRQETYRPEPIRRVFIPKANGKLRPLGISTPPRTAQRSNQPLGSAEVAHPFHPLRGQRFVVLKVRCVSGVETLSLRHPDLGSFAMPREWTNWAPPGEQTSAGAVPLLIDAFGLTALAELMASIAQGQFEVDR